MRKIKTFVVGPQTGYARFIKNRELVNNIEDAQVVVFTGGEDINPEIYNCKKHRSTYFNRRRDKEELEAYKKVRKDQFIVAICRGAQMCCALNGGKLVQDCSGHQCGYSHGITNGEVTYQITSIHHQMMYPYTIDKKNYDILYKSSEILSDRWEGDGIDPKKIMKDGEPEIIMFHTPGSPKALAIQGHPEMTPDSPVADMINELIIKNINE